MNLRRLQRRHWGLVVATAAVAGIAGMPSPSAVLVGGAAMSAILLGYEKGFDALVLRGRQRVAITLLFVKLAALAGLAWLILVVGVPLPDPVGLAAGVVCFTVAAVWESQSTVETSDGTRGASSV